MKLVDLWKRFSRFMKSGVTIRINSDWVEMVKQGQNKRIDHHYRVLGGKVSALLGEENSLAKASEVWGSEQQKIVAQINEDLGSKIRHMKSLLADLQSFSGIRWSLSFKDLEYNPVSVTVSEMKELLSKEITRAEKMKKELIDYLDLSTKALNAYLSTFGQQVSPLFTEQDCQILIEYTQKHDSLSEKSDSYGLEHIAEIRKRLGLSENDELHKLILSKKEEREKRGVQERLKEIRREEPNSGEEKKTEKQWVSPKTKGTLLPLRCR